MKKHILFSFISILFFIMLTGCSSSNPSANLKSSDMGFTFTYKGTDIYMNADASPIIDKLGEPLDYTEETSCAFDGLDKTWFYGDFYLTTYPDNGKDYTYQAWFVNDLVATKEGISIGDTKEEVEKIYGSDLFAESDVCSIVKDNSKLIIILSGDKVSSVQYEAIVQ